MMVTLNKFIYDWVHSRSDEPRRRFVSGVCKCAIVFPFFPCCLWSGERDASGTCKRVKRREVWKNVINYAWKLQTMLRLTHLRHHVGGFVSAVFVNDGDEILGLTILPTRQVTRSLVFFLLMRWTCLKPRARRTINIQTMWIFTNWTFSYFKRCKMSASHETQPRSSPNHWGKWIKQKFFASTAASWEFSGKLAWLTSSSLSQLISAFQLRPQFTNSMTMSMLSPPRYGHADLLTPPGN